MNNQLFQPTINVSTLVELLRYRAAHQSQQCAYRFLVDGETEEQSLTYEALDQHARTIAAQLQQLDATGERAILLYPPGLEFITAFFGCLYAGVIAVPTYPPRRNQKLSRLEAIVSDAQPSVVLTTAEILMNLQQQWTDHPQFAHLAVITTDDANPLEFAEGKEPQISVDSLAFLQYTSGSTGRPKGVMVSHGNIIYNQQMIEAAFQHDQTTIVVGWLPLFHDMGLIGNVLQPLYLGIPCILMSPAAFLQKPIRWLQAISHYRGSTSGGPNFAYDLCVNRISPEQKATLDLSCWKVAFNGAEPIHAETLQRFSDAFSDFGFRPETFYPCYGMAETTLLVSGGIPSRTPTLKHAQASALEHHQVVSCEQSQKGSRPLVGCGHTILEQDIRIVDPNTQLECSSSQVGEIWVAGKNVAQGYWNRDLETQTTFAAHLSNTGQGPYLRTGDLGFLDQDGEVFVTGRLKEVIIIRGRNYYPQDIERVTEKSHPALRPNSGVAFSIEIEGQERLIIAHEVERSYLRKLNVTEIASAVREAVSEEFELQVHSVLLLKTNSLLKTSSGKIQRRGCRSAWLSGTLNVVGHDELTPSTALQSTASQPQIGASTDSLKEANPEFSQLGELRTRIAQLLGVAVDKIGLHQPLKTLGLDSLQAIELKHFLENEHQLVLPITTFLEDISLYQLGQQLSEGSLPSMASTHKLVSETDHAQTYTASSTQTHAASRVTLPSPSPVSGQDEFRFSLFYFASNEENLSDNKYQLLLNGASFADQHNFTAIWVPERHFHPFGGLYPNPSVLGAALAMVTERVRLRAGSVVLPLQDPIRVAEEWSVVDNLSNGRVDLAFARGWNPNDFVLAPETYEQRTEVMASGIQAVQQLWRGESILRRNGMGEEQAVRIYPLPQQTELPIWITCSGGKERFTEAGVLGANILTALLFQPIDELAEKIALYRAARAEHGHDPAAGQVTLMLHTFVGEDKATVYDKVREPFTAYLRSSVDLWRQGADSLDSLTPQEQDELLAYAFERYVHTSALIGSPETCLEMAQRLRQAGVNEIACLIDFGVEHEAVMSALPALNRLREAANRPQGPTALADKLASGLTGPAVSPIDRNGSPIALSFAQQRLWFLNQLQEGNSPYNVTLPVRLTGNLDVDRLERAVREIVQRHEILRTRFPMIDGAPCQVIDSALPATLPVTDLQELPEEEKVAQLQQLTLREIQCSFDLANGPLLRFTLLRLEEQSHVLIFNYHHIIFDGWSIGIFLQEIATLYAASSNSEASPLPKLPIQYADFAHWQRQWLQGEVLETHLNYWRQQLAGAPSVLELPTDRPRPAVQTFRGGMETIAVDAALTQSLKALSQQAGTTLFMTLLAAFATLLARYSGQDDILVGSPIANRTRPEIKPLIGFFANTLVLRIQMQGNPTFEELLNQVRQVALDSYVHQDLPFEKLVEELQPQRSLTHSPLFQVMFVFQNAPIKPLELPELTITPINNQESSAKFDITLSLNEKPEGLSGFVNYNADLFEAPTIALMVKRFQTLLNAIVSAPQQPLSQLSLLSEAEQSQLLQGVKGFATATAASLSSQETGSDEGGIDHLLAELEGLSEEDAQRLLSNEILT